MAFWLDDNKIPRIDSVEKWEEHKKQLQEKKKINGEAKNDDIVKSKQRLKYFVGALIFAFLLAGIYNGLTSRPHEATIENQQPAVDIPKKDGTFERERSNDLEELCKDYLFYRKKILKANAAGDMEGVAKARSSFNQINKWLNEYNEQNVSNMFTKLEQSGYNPP